MALFEEPDVPVQDPPPAVRPKIEPKQFDGITIDTKYTPSSALLMYVEGSNWTVEYFSQVLGRDNEPTAWAPEREPAFQQYKRIKEFQLRVTTPLNFSQDDVNNTMRITGSALTYPFLVANKYDMFIADIGDGRAGLFTITNVTRATYLRDSVYLIEYEMVREVDQCVLDNLEQKTIETFYFSAASLATGCGPFITGEEKEREEFFQSMLRELITRYFNDFFSHEHHTLLVPDQCVKTFDYFTTDAILRVLDSSAHPKLRYVREQNITARPVMMQPTMWDALVNTDRQKLHGATQRAHLVSFRYFTGSPLLQAFGYSGIKRIVYPMDAPTDVDSQYDREDRRLPIGIEFSEGRPRRPLPGPYVPQVERDALWFKTTPLNDTIPPWEYPPDIHPVVKDEYYVFSEAFYLEAPAEQSKLELLVWQALRGDALNLEQLRSCLKYALDWDNLERYYYYPVLFVLLKIAGAR